MEPVITPLSQPLNSLPHFMPNQVLTHTQLNEMAVYLEQQDRFTRQRLIGIGIVCGLQAKLEAQGSSRTVKIARGVGVTSCGFLIDVPQELVFTKKKNYKTPADYTPFLLGAADTPIDCIELKEANSTEANISNLTAGDTDNNKIVVLFLDLEDKPNGKCIGENCDEKGNKWLFTLRVLLIDKAGANINSLHNINRVLKESYESNPFANPLTNDPERDKFFNPAFNLPAAFAERFGNINGINPAADFNLSAIKTFQKLEDNYRIIILDSATRVANALHKAYTLFKPVFDIQLLINTNPFSGFQNPKNSNTLANNLKDLLSTGNADYRMGNCQYVYDFVLDLINTYNELRDDLFALSSECSPDPSKFPRHLLLGELKQNVDFGKFNPADYEPPTVYRNHFISSPVINGQSARLKKIKMLVQRIQLMINNLSFAGLVENTLEEEKIIITPDKTCSESLGNQRIPFYYNQEGALQLSKYWNFDYTVQHRSFENRSYWSNMYVPPSLPEELKAKLINPLLYDICSFPKLSIEGHVGKELGAAIDQLKLLRKRYNLSFDILALKLDSRINEVALADDNLIADIQALYLTERNEIVCCLEDLKDFISKNKNILGLFLILTLYAVSENTASVNALAVMIYPFIIQLITAYEDAIDKMLASLTTDIKTFNLPAFNDAFPKFTSITSLFKYCINTWGDVESFVAKVKDNKIVEIDKDRWVLSDLISMLLNFWELFIDKVTDDCMAGKLYTVYRIFYERIKTFGLFHEMNKKVHGMEHIAGTSKGGTFIVVYEDLEERKDVIGKITDENGKPLAHVFVSDAETGVMYGATNNKGEYRITAPKTSKKINFTLPGYVAGSAGIRNQEVKTHKLYSYAYAASGSNKKGFSKASKSADPFVQMKASLNSIRSLDRNFAAFTDAVKFETGQSPLPHISFDNKSSYQVVADFFLPHQVHNIKTEIETFDACEEMGDIKMIDFKIIAGLFKKDAQKKAKNFTGKMKFNASDFNK
jgi:hypothetical protein